MAEIGGSIDQAYVFGHSDQELTRLKTQARRIDPITQRFLQAAGLGAGMRVLDVGSGTGDVAFLAAALVGESGEVIGIDRVPAALEAARARATRRSLRNIEFRVGDAAEIPIEQSFDAVIGRYVLQFQPDPAVLVRQLAAQVRPGGVVMFHEIDWGGLASFPESPTYDRCCRWGLETLRRHGTETRMGAKLHATFVEAGLPHPTMRLEALIGAGETCADLLELLADITATLLPEMERLGVATADEVGLDTLVERMGIEVRANSSTLVGHHQIGAWSRV